MHNMSIHNCRPIKNVIVCFIVVLRYISDVASQHYKLPVVRRHFEQDGSKSQLVIFPPPERDFEITHSIYRNHGVHLMELVVVAGDLSCYLNVLGITCLSESLLLKQNFKTSNNSSQENWKNYVKTEICPKQLHNYLQGLKENFRVCDGRGSINLQESRVDIRSTVERGQATGTSSLFPTTDSVRSTVDSWSMRKQFVQICMQQNVHLVWNHRLPSHHRHFQYHIHQQDRVLENVRICHLNFPSHNYNHLSI